jgi:hypothetical protein
MSSVFDAIVAGGYFVGFGGLTPEQEACKQFTKDNLDVILHVRQREKFVKEIRVCCCGYNASDEDEPMEDNNFSQFQFYTPFTHTLVSFEDKFDFLIKCVANGVCKVETGFEERYTQTILEVLTFRDTTVPASPHHVLDLVTLATPRTVGEISRTHEETMLLVDRFVKKRDTTAEALRHELLMLEEEQFQIEKQRGEHRSLMGWSEPNSPEVLDRRQHQQGMTDASVERIRAEIEIAQEEVKLSSSPTGAAESPTDDRAAAIPAVAPQDEGHGGDDAQPPAESLPLLNMLLRLQNEQVRLQQQDQVQEQERQDAIDAELKPDPYA